MSCNWGILGPGFVATKAVIPAIQQVSAAHVLHAAFSFPFAVPANYRAIKELGGGALLDIESYCVNATRWLSALEPQVVHARTSYSYEIDISTSALISFGQETQAHLQCSFAAAEHQVIEAVGSTAAVTAPLAFTAWRDDVTELLIQRGGVFERKQFAPADSYQAMVAHFTDCVLGNQMLLYPPEDGQATVRVLEMLREAGK